MFCYQSHIIVCEPDFRMSLPDGLESSVMVSRKLQDFEVNDCGFPLNDIAALNGAKTVQEYNTLLEKIQMYQAENPDTSNLTVQQLINCVNPRFAQTPAELVMAAEFVGHRMNEEFAAKVDALRTARAAQAQSQSPASPASPVESVSTT